MIRFRKIESLPRRQKKILIRNIDMFLKGAIASKENTS